MIFQRRNHFRPSFPDDCGLAGLRIASSASFTSSSVSLPDSTRCAITSLVRPPNRASTYINHLPARRRDHRIEDVGIDSPDDLDDSFPLQKPVERGVHRSVGWPLRLG